MKQQMVDALIASGLHEASAAVNLLRDGGRIEAHEHHILGDQVLRIYGVRAGHVSSLLGSHAARLAEATSELVSNLKFALSEAGHWSTIKGDQELHFLVFRTKGDGKVIGCLPVVNKIDVSAERWLELWSDNA
jgi:hypothetical protein